MSKKPKNRQGKKVSAKKSPAIKFNALSAREKRALLYYIAECRVKERDENHALAYEKIASKIKNWAKDNINKHDYDEKGDVSPIWVGRLMAKAIEHNFVKLGRYDEQELVWDIKKHLKLKAHLPHIVVAPNKKDLLRYLWEDLDEHLTSEVQGKRNQVILGVSGGRTMLSFARMTGELDLTFNNISSPNKKKLVICSLTSGGIPTDVAALSDAVVGIMADSLGVNAKGLLGPAWFPENDLEKFRQQKYVAEHEELLKNADFIITSVGSLRDPNSLMIHLLKQQKQEQFLKKYKYPADILYCCYRGLKGDKIDLPPEVEEGLYSPIDLDRLKEMVLDRKKPRYIYVVASGKEKGLYALPGILRGGMANYVYIDRNCAEGIIKSEKK
ncbi:MAG: sugar-binding domain-containing protein [Candidatus Hodarchaeales archaeon]|jgi:DNA-binding transcriptional regulator LsrR (DeoR family)